MLDRQEQDSRSLSVTAQQQIIKLKQENSILQHIHHNIQQHTCMTQAPAYDSTVCQ